jgi:hypothetical protein
VARLDDVDLREVAGLWAVLGVRTYHHQLTAAEGDLLVGYLTGDLGPARPRLYFESSDAWAGDKYKPELLLGLLGAKAAADAGVGTVRHLRGVDSGEGLDVGSLVRLPVDYLGETASLDILVPDPTASGAGPAWIDDDSDEGLGVFRRDPGGRFAVLSVSFEFGGVTPTAEERALLMGLYLEVLESPSAADPLFRRGDVDGSGGLSLSDPVQLLGALFLGGTMDGGCEDAADADDDGALSLTDAVVILEHLFLGGPPPAAPGPAECGLDPTADALEECRPLPGACP